jgi:tryptophan synthase beta chain
VFEAACLFARTEGIIPAPETAPAIKAAVDEAVRCREANDPKCIVFNFSGHGHFDLAAYDAFLEGKLEDLEYSPEVLARALAALPQVPGT